MAYTLNYVVFSWNLQKERRYENTFSLRSVDANARKNLHNTTLQYMKLIVSTIKIHSDFLDW